MNLREFADTLLDITTSVVCLTWVVLAAVLAFKLLTA